MKTPYIKSALITFLWSISSVLYSQNIAINTTASKPNSSALLDISDSGSGTHRGLLIPRMTTAERNSIALPAQSLQIYNTTDSCLEIFAGNRWQKIWCSGTTCVPTSVMVSASPNPICTGNTLTLTGNATGATTWSWTGPKGFSSTSQSPALSITSTSQAGVYSLTASNACGPATPLTVSVTVDSIPVTPAVPSGNTSPSTSAAYTYIIAAVSGATSYNWSVSTTNGSVTGGQGTTSVTITFGGTAGAMNICVTANNSCGTSSSSCLSVTTISSCTDGTGGTITHVNGNTIHTFTTSGTFTPDCAMNIQVLVVAGGGGGSMAGGGAGGLLYNASYAVIVQNYSVTIGAGGTGIGNGQNASNGSNSVFGTLTAIGGGGGGGNSLNGSSGGSGGGAGIGGSAYSAGSGTTGQGNQNVAINNRQPGRPLCHAGCEFNIGRSINSAHEHFSAAPFLHLPLDCRYITPTAED
jgi:hypothetical protein